MKVTIKEIAVKAGVSPSAVSKALNGKSDIGDATKEKISRISRELGYTPNMIARNLVKKSNNTIGVLVPDISTPIYPSIYKGINETAIKYGYTLLLGDTKRSLDYERNYIITMMENRVAGLLISPVSNDVSHIKEVVNNQVPVIYFGGKVNDSMDNYIGIDNYNGARLAALHLVESGHRGIMMVCDDLSTKTRKDRVDGYKDVMIESGLQPDVIVNNEGLRDRDCGRVVMTKVIAEREKLPTAVFTLNDLMAIGVMEALNETGYKIPEDISVMGYDDISFVSLPMIGLSTIWQPKLETGVMALELMHQMIKKEGSGTEKRRIILQPEIRIRKSTKKL